MPRPFPPLLSDVSQHVVTFDLAPASAPVGVMSGDALTSLSGLAVPWGVPVSRFGVRLVFTPDTTQVPEDLSTVKLLVGHDDDRPAGYATGARFDDDGLRMDFAVDESHPRAADLMREVGMKWRDGLSVGVEMDQATEDAIWAAMWDPPDPDADPIPLGGTVREVSAVSVPQFNTARIGAAGALARFNHQEGQPAMPTITEPEAPAPPEAMPMADLAAALAPFLGVQTGAHPLAEFSSLGEYLLAAREGSITDDQRVAFALADQITDNNPGVLPPTWLTTIVGIMDRGRPTVTAFGGPSSAGDSGMSINWPYYDGGYAGLIGEQVTEKTEVTTRRVDIKNTSADLKTYAGASDISYQLLRRSAPSYREAYSRILSIAYGVVTDGVFATAVVGAATAAGDTWAIGEDLEGLLAALFAASAQVDDAVGVPADVALASPDVFAAIGTLSGLVPGQYGTQNVGGTADASTLKVNVSGLVITKDRSLPANTLLVSSSEAASWAEDGPFAVEGDDVAKLGLDVGIWGMGVSKITVPAAIVAVGAAPVPPGARSSRSTKADDK